jgi:glycosyltransferase involved in cell wall biosynthesis
MGGPAHQVALLSGERFDPTRYETVLAHGRVPAHEGSLEPLIEREGVQSVRIDALGPALNPRADSLALAQLARLVHRFRPYIIHTHTAKAGFLGRLAGLLVRPRPLLVHTYHGHVLEGYFGRFRSGLYRRLERTLGARTDRLVAVSAATVDDLVRLGVGERHRFEVIPVGLDLDAVVAAATAANRQAVRRELEVGPDEVLFIFAGRLVPIKRVDVLLGAIAVARVRKPRVRLLVVGDGDQRPWLEQLSASLGLGDIVTFLGNRSDFPRLLAGADAAVLSSDNEGTPVSLIEAAAAELPAAATEVGGAAEVVRPDTGMLVPRGAAPALGARIAELAGDADLRRRLGARAREVALARFSIDRLIADVDDLYGRLLAARSRSRPDGDQLRSAGASDDSGAVPFER